MSYVAALGISFVVLLGAIAAMAIGVLFGRRPIAGSCGGIAGRCATCAGAATCPRRRTADAAKSD